MIEVDKFECHISSWVPPGWDLCFVYSVRKPQQNISLSNIRQNTFETISATWEVMALQNIDNVKLSLDDHQPVCITICVASLILGLPLSINTWDHLRESTINLDVVFQFL